MKNNRSLTYLLINLVLFQLFSCQVKKESTALDQQILGSWENVSMEVSIVSASNMPDSSSFYTVPAGQWEEKLEIKPINTTYRDDGSYVSIYKNLEDSVLDISTGEWRVEGDSLFLDYQGMPFSYLTNITGDTARFRGKVDWDQDGEIDDIYTGIQVRSPEPEIEQ